MTEIEAPSGKNETTENFPVAQLVERKYRKHVEAYYVFARAADDISDSPDLTPEEKVERLDQFGQALLDENDNSIKSVIPLRESLKITGVTPKHALDLLIAFKQDSSKLRYENWEELIEYCEYSANPVGRYLLDLHGEEKLSWPANDALCTVLQIINHVQDCADDLKELNRLYIPQDIMREYGTNDKELLADKATPELRACLDAVLERMEPLIEEALTFTPQVKNRMLRIDVAVINNVALKLTEVLKERDPLSQNVKLNKLQKISALVRGAGTALFL